MSADLLDRRQRLAAALILSAVDLPANAIAWAAQTIQAASVCPNLMLDELDINAGRLPQLRIAVELLNELIKEAAP